MLCRDMTAAQAVRDEIVRHAPRATVEVVRCDLASLASVREAAAAVRRDYPPLGLLVNNAGMVSTRHRTSVDGFELTFATNHLGPFLLTALAVGSPGQGGTHRHGRLPHPLPRPPGSCRGHKRARPLRGHGRLCPVEARQRHAYVRARAPHGRHRHQRQLPAPGSRGHESAAAHGCVSSSRCSRGSCSMPSAARAPPSTWRSIASVAGVTGRYFDEYQLPRAASPLANDVAAAGVAVENERQCGPERHSDR